MTKTASSLLAGALALFSALPAIAQSPLSLAGISVYRYENLIDHTGDSGVACCAPFVLGGPDGHFLYIRAVFDVAWSDEVDRVSISSSNILLQVPGEEDPRRAQGRYDWFGIYNTSAGSMSERRPNDWPNETAQVYLNGVWYLPRGVTSGELRIGEDDEALTVPVDLNVPVSAPITPGQTMVVTPRSITRAAPVNGEDRSNRIDIPGQMAARVGTLLQVEFDVTPAYSTDTDAQAGENQAFLRASWFALVGPDGMPLMALGTQPSNDAAPRSEWTTSISWDDAPRSSDQSLYFLGAGTPGTYQLYLLEDPVAQFTLQ